MKRFGFFSAPIFLLLLSCAAEIEPSTTGAKPDPNDNKQDNPNHPETNCSEQATVAYKPPPLPEILIVLDASGSMEERVGDQRRIDAAKDAVINITNQYAEKMRFGLSVFPFGGPSCGPGQVVVDVGENTAGQINTLLAPLQPGGDTPTSETLANARNYFAGRPSSESKRYVLLATDGEPTCSEPGPGSDFDKAIWQLQALNEASLPTFVLGIGLAQSALEQMAVAGGTTTPYPADSPSKIQAAFEAIAEAVSVKCEIPLTTLPKNDDLLTVAIAGKELPRDPSHANGWDYDAKTNAITLFGESCEQLQTGNVTNIDISLGCTDID